MDENNNEVMNEEVEINSNEILEAIESGKIISVQDFITYNLDICSFAQEAASIRNAAAMI